MGSGMVVVRQSCEPCIQYLLERFSLEILMFMSMPSHSKVQ